MNNSKNGKVKKLYLFLIIALMVTFSACKNNTSNKTIAEKIEPQSDYLGKFNVSQTNNPGIIKFFGPKGTIFLSTTFFEESQQ